MNYQYLDTPIGRLRLVSTGSGLSAIEFAGHHGEPGNGTAATDAVLERAGGQLLEYFAGRRRQFDLPLAPVGTPFQRAVWNALAAIPWGALRSYADIARAIERPTAVRAVGAANGRNPLPIVVPTSAISLPMGKPPSRSCGPGGRADELERELVIPVRGAAFARLEGDASAGELRTAHIDEETAELGASFRDSDVQGDQPPRLGLHGRDGIDILRPEGDRDEMHPLLRGTAKDRRRAFRRPTEFQRRAAGERWAALEAKGASKQWCLWASTSTKNPAYRDVPLVMVTKETRLHNVKEALEAGEHVPVELAQVVADQAGEALHQQPTLVLPNRINIPPKTK